LATFNDGNVYLLWTENRILQNPFRPSEIAPDTDDFFVASMDNGRTFGTPINLKPILTVTCGWRHFAALEARWKPLTFLFPFAWLLAQ